ncbi:MAG: HD family phosphohydrolase [Gemmatimonadota bacterium]
MSRPDSLLGRRLAYHGLRVLLLVALAVWVAVLFPPSDRVGMARYSEGMVSPEDIIARVPFSVPKSREELDTEKRLAMASVPPTYDFIPQAADSMAAHLERFFDSLDSAGASGDRNAVEGILRSTSLVATPSQVDRLMDPEVRRLLRTTALTATREILSRGVVDAAQALDVSTGSVTVRDGDRERSVPAGEIVTSRDFLDAAQGLLPPGTPPDVADLLRIILIRNIEYTYVLDVVATERDRDAAARSVPATKYDVLRGQAIVRRADPIGPEELERLSAYEAALRDRGLLESPGLQAVPLLGTTLLNVLLLLIFGLLVYFFRPEVYANLRWLILITLLPAVYFGAAALIAANGLSGVWLPIAFVALPVGALWDARMSLVLVLVLAAVTGSLPPFSDYGVVLAVMVGGSAAALSIRAVRRRSETWVSIALITASMALALLAHGLAVSASLAGVAHNTLVAAGNATVASLLAMGSLWIFELFTGITTDQTLLEWADPTRPLLKRLSLEAPGTYAHTINVANLAEAAAAAIGANSLLCRVGVYYHDVGKVLKPHYFVENQPDGRNPHDKLKPETSAAIVREHITEGIRLAREAGVPEVIVRFISEHHGTQRIGFFYQKALEESEGEVDEALFSYPGPKPQSKETAIVMLADSCESATRAMQDPTPERVRELIDTVVNGKIASGQLDEAPLTLKELSIIKDQFVKILSGMHHRRIDYPETKHITDAEEDEGKTGEGGASEGGAEDPSGDAGAPGRAPVEDRTPDRGKGSP